MEQFRADREHLHRDARPAVLPKEGAAAALRPWGWVAFDFVEVRPQPSSLKISSSAFDLHGGFKWLSLLFFSWGLHSRRTEDLGTWQSSCFTDRETEAHKQFCDLSSATWLLSSWHQNEKGDLFPPGPKLFPVFALPPDAKCHLILVHFPNHTAWRNQRKLSELFSHF